MLAEHNSGLESEINLRRIKLLSYKVHEYRIERAWKRFENAGFKPLLIKGWAAAQYYTEPSDRRFNDVDLMFAAPEFSRAEKFLEEFTENTAIDLHNGARHLDTLTFESLYSNSQILKCGKTDIRVLRPEDHLRILCVHWLIDGGAKKDKLWDIYYAVKNRPIDFDWDRCLNVVSRTRRRWILCTIGLASKYLGLDVSDTPIADSVKEIPQWLITAVEKEWQSDTLIIPLHFLLNDGAGLWRQIKKRIPPNPIQATVEMEGEFDDKPRIFYQIGNLLCRLPPAVRRIAGRFRRLKSKNHQKNNKT